MLWLGPLLALLAGVVTAQWLAIPAAITVAVALWCILWWVTEPVPIPVTSMLPLSLFPLTGVLDSKEVAAAYGSPLIILLLGGFILSQGMSSTGTHRRLAVAMVNLCRRIGGHNSERALVAGFMLAAAVLSMWISNTATTLMLLPIALAVIEKSRSPLLPLVLMLGIAYAANVGGMGTPIGTPPNLVMVEVYRQNTGQTIGFIDWMRWGVPVVVLFVPLVMWWLTRKLGQGEPIEMPKVGDWTAAERRVLCVFGLTALLWITRSDPFGGWSGWLGLSTANDAAVALLGAILLFIIPDARGGRLLTWEQAVQIPWGMLLLFAGGICIARAFNASGLSAQLGEFFSLLTGLPVLLMMLALCLGVSFLTETTSNTATTTLLMPILAAAAMGASIPPELLMVPAALSASCAFMLPVATAPNAVVFSSGMVDPAKMMRIGVVLNIMGAVLIAVLLWLIL
ncbi:MAG: SLC13 family permease [Gammaproteobacteria bacterium]|nr:SLC13 family permease [Gammaproteobacteria bacterium]MBT8150806.1 SLC13 family permease [Gammaproteobacteria bacterium]NND39486.1 SLC13/DASS family transporter [Pseudomonadales bacterium]NNM11582.1 SLC13/DASS family transporter [Pseudomonadales bacterium]